MAKNAAATTAADAMKDVATAVHEHKGLFLGLGVVLIIVGTAAILFPQFATLSAEILVGWLLVFSGVTQIIHAFSAKRWGGTFWEAVVGLLQTVAGLILLFYPLAGVVTLTIFLAAMFIAEGVFRALLALKLKPAPGWGWVLAGGIVSVVVGVMIWSQLPSSAVWAIGLLVGINIAMAGWTLVMIAMASKAQAGK